MSTSLGSFGLGSLSGGGGSLGGASSKHRRHQSDPFASSLAPMSDADVAAFLAADDDAGDMFLPGSLMSFDDNLGDIGDLLLPEPAGAPPVWPSPRTPGRKHRRTISEPVLGGFGRAQPDVHAGPGRPAPARAGSDPAFQDDLSHPLILGDGMQLDSFDLDLADDPMNTTPAPPAPPPPPTPPPPLGPVEEEYRPAEDRPATRARGGRRARSNPASARAKARAEPKESKSKKYRCSRCGQIKANHVCPFVVNDSVAVASQADPNVTVTTAGAVTLIARSRAIATGA